MFNQRQINILSEMCNKSEQYFTASYFADKLSVSLRTIQGDMKHIKTELSKSSCAKIISVVPKGSCLQIIDNDDFTEFFNSIYQKHAHASLSYPSSRLNQILLYLINNQKTVSILSLEERFYISHSTLMNDLKKIEEILSEFDLELLKSKNRIFINGPEINKRQYLVEKYMYLACSVDEEGNDYVDENQISKIKSIITDIFIEYKYHIADTDIQNAILFLGIMVKRMREGLYIKPGELVISEELGMEKEVSQDILNKLQWEYSIKVSEDEINYFALYLKGQSTCKSKSIISVEIDEFVLRALSKIKQNFGIDFTDNVDLRISLALHCMPLSIRVKYNMQLKNNMLDYIKKMFPLGYDIAMYFSLLFEKMYNGKLTDAEIALIAVHFYSSLLEINNKKGTKKILVITSLKNSMIMLLRQTLLKWFSNKIYMLDFLSPTEAKDIDLDYYDIYLTTEKGEYFEQGLALYINTFPNNYDYINIKIMIDGFENISDILQSFPQDLFYHTKNKNKNKIIEMLCEKASQKYNIDLLYEEVIKREERGSTYFGKGIAVPHPMHSLSSDTFVAVHVSKDPIIWDEEQNLVNVIVLVCVGKNNPQAFQLWDYFSKVFTDETFASGLIEEPTYDKFICILKDALNNKIREFQ